MIGDEPDDTRWYPESSEEAVLQSEGGTAFRFYLLYDKIHREDILDHAYQHQSRSRHQRWDWVMNSFVGGQAERLLTELETASLLKLSTRTLQAWRVRGDGPAFVRAGRAVRYRASDIVAWIEQNTVRASRASPQ